MIVRVNSKEQPLPERSTVKALLEVLGLSGQRVAVEVNLALVTRSEWETHILQEGDRVEVVTFVGGG